jgi:hypothetical protein
MNDSEHGHTDSSPVNSALLHALEPYLDDLADRISARLMKGRERMVSQAQSELGPRRHRAAVKRRIEQGQGGAAVSPDGRKFLLTPEAVREELARGPAPAPASAPSGDPAGNGRGRAREVSDFERKLMSGLRAVKT